MTKLKLLGAVAILSATIVSPALAQQVIYNPGYCAQFYPDANCQNKGPNSPYTGDYQRRQAYRNGNWDNGWNNNSGFWPGDVAAGAVGTAGAIAGAPFRSGRSYADMNGDASYCAQRYRSYDPASGTYLGRDGRRHVCQ
jgi:hypothetical protein